MGIAANSLSSLFFFSFSLSLNGLVALAGGLALQAIFLHCNQKSKSVIHRIRSHDLCLILWGGTRTESKEASREHARKTIDFTKRKSFHSDLDLGL